MTRSRNYLKRRKEKAKCVGKKRYLDADSAWAAARRLRNDTGHPARAYKCPGLYGQPKHWHVTGGQKW